MQYAKITTARLFRGDNQIANHAQGTVDVNQSRTVSDRLQVFQLTYDRFLPFGRRPFVPETEETLQVKSCFGFVAQDLLFKYRQTSAIEHNPFEKVV